jgi:multidrug resistance efflux pump
MKRATTENGTIPANAPRLENGVSGNFGFPRQATSESARPAIKPTPLPKRPKGRWFFGLILCGVTCFAGFQIWNAFFRYRAHGIVDGRLIQVSPPWDGVVQYVLVREGETVRQGQPLVIVEDLELRQRQAVLANELQMAQATLESEASKLRWQSSFQSNQSQKALAEYYEALGKLLQEQAQLATAKTELARGHYLAQSRAIPARELDQLQNSVTGQQKKVEELQTSLAELKLRADQTSGLINKSGDLKDGLAAAGHEQLKPFLSRIEGVQSEMAWLQKRLDQTRVCAPVNGTVVRTQHFVGEYCKASDPLLTILEEGSVQFTLYLPQKESSYLKVEDEVDLVIDPYPYPVRGRVSRIGDRYESAPTQIAKNYWATDKLLPVCLQPSDSSSKWMTLRVGEVVKLPCLGANLLRGAGK